jgi:hypothetical protein
MRAVMLCEKCFRQGSGHRHGIRAHARACHTGQKIEAAVAEAVEEKRELWRTGTGRMTCSEPSLGRKTSMIEAFAIFSGSAFGLTGLHVIVEAAL